MLTQSCQNEIPLKLFREIESNGMNTNIYAKILNTLVIISMAKGYKNETKILIISLKLNINKYLFF